MASPAALHRGESSALQAVPGPRVWGARSSGGWGNTAVCGRDPHRNGYDLSTRRALAKVILGEYKKRRRGKLATVRINST